MNKRILNFVFCAGTLFSSVAFSQERELKGVKMPEEINVGAEKLVLNGMGLREVTRFGFRIKVYVGGLYLKTKETSAESILNSDETKQLVMEYVRSVDRKDILEAFRNAYYTNCIEKCDTKADQFKPFGVATTSVRDRNKMILTFYKDKLDFEVTGPYAKKMTFQDPALSKNMLAVYLGKEPPTPEFKTGLLGK